MRKGIARIVVMIALRSATWAADPKPAQNKILVGPNVLVSRDSDLPHDEYMVAANPTNPKNLVGAVMTASRAGGAAATKVYTTKDGGYSWTSLYIPKQGDEGQGTGDPQVAFGPDGTAFVTLLGNHVDVYRSEDGGATWLSPVRLAACDHEQLSIDTTGSKYRGRVYIWGVYGKPHRVMQCLFRSDDGGRSFAGPITVVEKVADSGLNSSCPPVILSNGTILLPYNETTVDENAQTFGPLRKIRFVTSSDGGETFSAPHEIAVQYVPSEHIVKDLKQRLANLKAEDPTPRLGGTFDFPTFPQLVADTHTARFKNRIYAVWPDTRFGNSRILFTYSSDRGETWTHPRQLNPGAPVSSYQYQAMIAVNDDGVVGIEWFDTRRSLHQDSYDLYFTASLDGGESFIPAKPVTSKPSFPLSPAHLKPEPYVVRTANAIDLFFNSQYALRGGAGEYIGLTADKTGVFHALWPDSRNGVFQVWTAQIKIGEEQEGRSKPRIAEIRDVSADTVLVVDPSSYDPQAHQLKIPVRLKNTSDHSLYGPIKVMIDSLRLYYEPLVTAGFQAPTILNATNGKSGKGAMFDYSSSLRDFAALGPGEMTEAVLWILEVDSPGQAEFQIEASVTSVRGGVGKP